MAKHPTSSRVKREDDGPDDAFVAAIKSSYAWGRENSRVATIVFAVVAIVAIGALWMTSQQRQLEAQAAARLNEVQQTMASGNMQLAIRDLQAYLDRFGGTDAADQGRLMLAGLLFEQGQAPQAIEALGDLPDDLDEPFGLAAARMEAAALEETGAVEDAISTYLQISESARFEYQRREALADAARLHLQQGEPDEAARLYQRVVDTFEEGDTERSYYEIWLAEARAQAGDLAAAPRQSTDTTTTEADNS